MSLTSIDTVFFDLGDTLVISSAGWIPGAKESIAALRAKGVRLGIISNTGTLSRAEVLELLPSDFSLSDFVPELVIFSSEVGHEKPSKDIFRLAVTRSGVEARNCLYCSESLVETLAAQHVDMRAARVLAGATSDVNTLVAKLQIAGLLP